MLQNYLKIEYVFKKIILPNFNRTENNILHINYTAKMTNIIY